MIKLNRSKKIFALFLPIVFLSGCIKKDLSIEPSPRVLGKDQQIIFQNRDYWKVDLAEDIKEYNLFLEETFKNIDDYIDRNKKRYHLEVKKTSENTIFESKGKKPRGFYGDILSEEYSY